MASFASTRRSFLRAGLAGSLAAAGALRAQPGPPAASVRAPSGRARNVVFCVSDGMSLGTLTLAERYLRRQQGRGTRWLGMYARPDVRRALMDTASASSLVTDSAAAATAWGSGVRVNNGSINVAPDGRELHPIWRIARGAGRATGLVTTATVTHATPAGFVARVNARNDEGVIAPQYLEERVDVVLGGGARFFDAAPRGDGRDLTGEFARAGYTVARDRATLQAAPPGRLLGLFSSSHVPYEVDRMHDRALAEVPSLPEMTRAALERLAVHPGGFVLQVEGARVDHAAHANDIGGLLQDQLAFDDALGVVLDWVRERDDTLVVVTSDHGNANPGLNGPDGAYEQSNAACDRLLHLRSSNTAIVGRLAAAGGAGADVVGEVKASTGVELTAAQTDILRAALRGEHRDAYAVRNPALVTLGQLLANHLWVGWTGTAHTADYTELAAFGPGSEAIGGIVENRALFGVMVRALGIGAPAA